MGMNWLPPVSLPFRGFTMRLKEFTNSVKYGGEPKVWPQPTESLATQEETGESALQASLRSLAEARQIPAKFRRFCYACGSTGQFTYVAKLSVGYGQTFG